MTVEADESYDGAMRRALNAEAKVRALEAETEIHFDSWRKMKARAEKAEAEVAALKAELREARLGISGTPSPAPAPETRPPPFTKICKPCEDAFDSKDSDTLFEALDAHYRGEHEPPAKPDARPMHCDEPYCPICDAPDPGPRDEGETKEDGA